MAVEIDEYEKELTRRALAYVNAQRREAKVPYRRARLWQVSLVCFLTALVLLAAFHGWLDGLFKAFGR